MFQVRVGPTTVWSQGDDLDLLIAFDQESIDLYYRLIRPGGALLYNSDESTPPPADNIVQHALPLNELAKAINFQRGRNIIAIGAMVKLFELPYDVAIKVVEKQLGKKHEIFAQNLIALKAGHDYVEQHIAKTLLYSLGAPVEQRERKRLVVNGNQALAMGAIAAKCRFYAGYPITPASDIMEFLALEFPRLNGTMIQAEDEIAAIAMAIGASFAGQRAMTATSGPGLALMIELLGHATMTEIPVVVVDVQRAGPSTGLPTKVSQGDLRLAVFGMNDDAPRIVIAPVSVEDNFYQMINAFNLAERYQSPVVFLSDQDMSVRVQTIPAFDHSRVRIETRSLWNPEGDGAEHFERYESTASGISSMSVPGMKGGQYVAEGLEHTPSGTPNYAPEQHIRNMEKRAKKVRTAAREAEAWNMFERFGDDRAEVGIVGWGSTYGPVREAVARAEAEGMPVAVLYTKMIYPLPTDTIGKLIANRKVIIVPEMNFTGQFARMIQAQFWREVISLRNYGGNPFTARTVYEKIRDAYRVYTLTAEDRLA